MQYEYYISTRSACVGNKLSRFKLFFLVIRKYFSRKKRRLNLEVAESKMYVKRACDRDIEIVVVRECSLGLLPYKKRLYKLSKENYFHYLMIILSLHTF